MVLSSFGGVSLANAEDAPTAPTLVSAVAEDDGGDSVVFTFSESVADIEITEDNINDIFSLSNSHSFLDGDGNIGDVNWSDDSKKLTIELSDNASLPTVAVGDTVTITGDDLKDEDGNAFTGSKTITGSFTADKDDDDSDEDEDCEEPTVSASVTGDDDDDSEEDSGDDCDDSDDSDKKSCNNALKNGKLYKIGDAATVYLASSHCTLKPFRGAAVFHARGHKFTDVIQLSSVPAGVTVSSEPALPVEGTLIKGSDKTVWFIDHNGKRRGFVSAEVFTKLGFKFEQVKEISDSDLSELPTETVNVSDATKHPDGSLIKCGNSAAVFLVVGGKRKAFTSAEVFQGRGHSFDHILNVDCGRFAYSESTPVTE